MWFSTKTSRARLFANTCTLQRVQKSHTLTYIHITCWRGRGGSQFGVFGAFFCGGLYENAQNSVWSYVYDIAYIMWYVCVYGIYAHTFMIYICGLVWKVSIFVFCWEFLFWESSSHLQSSESIACGHADIHTSYPYPYMYFYLLPCRFVLSVFSIQNVDDSLSLHLKIEQNQLVIHVYCTYISSVYMYKYISFFYTYVCHFFLSLPLSIHILCIYIYVFQTNIHIFSTYTP